MQFNLRPVLRPGDARRSKDYWTFMENFGVWRKPLPFTASFLPMQRYAFFAILNANYAFDGKRLTPA